MDSKEDLGRSLVDDLDLAEVVVWGVDPEVSAEVLLAEEALLEGGNFQNKTKSAIAPVFQLSFHQPLYLVGNFLLLLLFYFLFLYEFSY